MDFSERVCPVAQSAEKYKHYRMHTYIEIETVLTQSRFFIGHSRHLVSCARGAPGRLWHFPSSFEAKDSTPVAAEFITFDWMF